MLLPGISSQIARTNELVRQFAEEDGLVFITGEVGTERAFAAKLIHQLSPRAGQYLTKISVSWKLPPDLAQYFSQCSGGTLLINLQKEFPIDMQYTLVEMASHGAFADPMSGDVVESDVRIILMTSMDLDSMVERGPFLPELKELYRARHIEIPALRDRREDIPALVRYAIKRAHDTGRTPAINADPQVLALFRQWHWPGNAEDLLLVTAQAAIQAHDEYVTLRDLPEDFLRQVPQEAIEAARGVKSPRSRKPRRQSEYQEQSVIGSLSLSTPLTTPLNVVTPRLNENTPPDNLQLDDTQVLPREEYFEKERAAAAAEASEEELLDAADLDTPVPTSEEQSPEFAEEPVVPRSVRVLQLARRLNAQSNMLSRQMSGPLDTASTQEILSKIMDEATDDEALYSLEKELDHGLGMVLQLRRQMALMNLRQRQSAETVRDLVQRISLAGGDVETLSANPEVMEEARELASTLESIDKIMQRLSTDMPMIGQHLHETLKGNPTAPAAKESLFGNRVNASGSRDDLDTNHDG